MSLESLRIYKTAAKISDEISRIVSGWSDFHKTTLGSQLVRAADSIANNISEGYGRVSTGERVQFFMYADGSNSEVRNCLARAVERGLIERAEADLLIEALRNLSIQIVEFSYAILQRDTDYKGPFRERISRRRAWRTKR